MLTQQQITDLRLEMVALADDAADDGNVHDQVQLTAVAFALLRQNGEELSEAMTALDTWNREVIGVSTWSRLNNLTRDLMMQVA